MSPALAGREVLHSPVEVQLDYFHVLAILNSAAMNRGVHVFFQIIVLSQYMPGVGFLDHMATIFLVF